MRSAKTALAVGVIAALAVTPGLSSAEGQCGGSWVQIGTTIVTVGDNPTWPFHLAIGTCNAGRCTYTDKDGDTWTDVSSFGTDGRTGKWRTVSGTGKYQNSTSAGWTRIVRTDPGPDGMVWVGAWGGTCSVVE